MTAPFSVLYVCSANLCRSVTATTLTNRSLRHRSIGSDQRWRVRSAGLDVRADAALPRRTADAMRELDIPINPRPRQLDEDLVRAADLILTAERSQRAHIVRMYPSANQKTFTIRQFGRLCAAGREATGTEAVHSGTELLELAALGRSHVQPVGQRDDDIVDPASALTAAATYTCLSMIRSSIEQILGD